MIELRKTDSFTIPEKLTRMYEPLLLTVNMFTTFMLNVEGTSGRQVICRGRFLT